MRYSRYLAFPVLLVLSGCLSPGVAPVLPAPDAARWNWVVSAGDWPGPDEYRLNLVTFVDRYNDRTHVVRFDVYLTRDRLVMAAQTTLGIPLYETTLAEGRLSVTRHVAQVQDIPVERALADFLFATWPLTQLTAALTPAGYTVREEGDRRLLVDRMGAKVLEVIPVTEEGATVLQIFHHDIPLEITVRQIQRELVGQ